MSQCRQIGGSTAGGTGARVETADVKAAVAATEAAAVSGQPLVGSVDERQGRLRAWNRSPGLCRVVCTAVHGQRGGRPGTTRTGHGRGVWGRRREKKWHATRILSIEIDS